MLITACKAVYGRNAVAFVGAESITAPAMSRALVVCRVVTDVPQDCLQVSSFLMLDMLIYVWHQLPLIGRLAGPVTQFLSMLECMSMPQAVVLALLGFVGPLRWWTFQFVRVWRTSRVRHRITPSTFHHALSCKALPLPQP